MEMLCTNIVDGKTQINVDTLACPHLALSAAVPPVGAARAHEL